MNTATIPVYISEVSRPKHRGRNFAFGQAILIAGVAISYWIDYGLSFVNSQASWVRVLLLEIHIQVFRHIIPEVPNRISMFLRHLDYSDAKRPP
jgi:hypothetical protein